jgi:hypothetical protein|tara:strand:+ start:2501 stop:2617 length:117 start_codon:yes stop_codon:yes gene_type:complete
MKKFKLTILKVIQETCHKIGDWAWMKRVILMKGKNDRI